MNIESLYKVSKKLEGLIDGKSLDDIYLKMIDIKNTHTEFFEAKNIKSLDVVKLCLLIYSYKNWGNFKIGDDMIKNLYFFKLIKTDGNELSISCDQCNGDGYNRCYNCDASGDINCDNCDGRGKIEGDDGDEVDCDECGGGGKITCNECGGDSEITCNECGGEGYFENNNYEYVVLDCCYWHRELMSILVDSYELKEPLTSQGVIDNTKFLILSSYSIESDVLLDEDVYYCAHISYEPKFVKNRSIRLLNGDIPDYLNK